LGTRTALVLRKSPLDIGHDLDVICSSLDALKAGLDPYYASKPFPLPYPVLHVYLFAPLCTIDSETYFYTVVFAAIVALSCLLLWQLVPSSPLDRALVFAAAFLGFDAFRWQLLTGNVAVLEIPLAATTVWLLSKDRLRWAAVSFGLMASMKLFPLIGVIAFLLIPASPRERMWGFLAAIVAFLAVHLPNAVLFNEWMPSYVTQLLGRLPDGASYEPGGWNNPNTLDLVFNLLQRIGLQQAPISMAALAFLGMGVGFWAALARAGICTREGKRAPVIVFSLLVLVLWLFLFRQKLYAFATFIPFLIAAGYGLGRHVGRGSILISIMVPVSLLTHSVPIRPLFDYYQLVGAWTALLFLLSCATDPRPPRGLGRAPSEQDT
jgi:hypothetical protein